MSHNNDQIKATTNCGICTDRGLCRPDNQDFCGKFPPDDFDITPEKGQLFIVADGMGGHVAGREASETAVLTIQQVYFAEKNRDVPESLKHAFEIANTEIYNKAQTHPAHNKMGTTCTALVVAGNFAYIAHIGDSRAYRINRHTIQQLTEDHTYVAEMQRYKILTKQEAQNHAERSVLYRALGIEPSAKVDIIPKIVFRTGDYFLLHTDGLKDITPEEMQVIVVSNPPQQACEKLIQLANARGGEDNSTVQIVQILSGDQKTSIFETVKTGKSLRSKWMVVGLCLFAIISATVYFLSDWFKKPARPSGETERLTNGTSDAKYDSVVNISSESQSIPDRLRDADYFLTHGYLDSAMTIYEAILAIDPSHISAMNGMNLLVAEYKNQADIFYSDSSFLEALTRYKKLEVLLPKDENIKNLISLCEQNLQEIQAQQAMQSEYTEPSDSGIIEPVTEIDRIKPTAIDTVVGIQFSFWDFTRLNQQQYKLKSNHLMLHSDSDTKKVFYNLALKDVEIQVTMQNLSNGVRGEYGIIFGHHLDEQTDQESFFLYTLDETGNILMRKVVPGANKVIFSMEKQTLPFDSPIKTLKIRCLGPFVMAYAENRRLKDWKEEEFIIGKVGLFADPDLQVEFSEFKIIPLISRSGR